ncbi:MAG: hypothetical protein AAGC93_10185 [Cyanobacteria bacterium P01_F01_bin.53]
MNKWSKLTALASANLALTTVLVEGSLRILPTIIPADVLIHFEPTLRSQIATGRFPTAKDAVGFKRTDGGFPFTLWKPFAEINYSFQDPGTVNTVRMDEIGFCNPPSTVYSEQSAFNVVALGDSFIWCTTVRPEDTWVAQLATVAKVSTYNLGHPGIGLYEYLRLLERYGLKKAPEVVVLNVYEGNDLRDALRYHSYRQSGSAEQRVNLERTFGPLSRHSYAWNWLRAAITPEIDPDASSDEPTDDSAPNELKDGISEDDINFRYDLSFKTNTVAFNPENGDRDEVVHAKRLAEGDISLDIFSDALKQFIQLAKTHNFKPVVTYTPSAYTAYTDVVTFEQPELSPIMSAFSQRQRNFFANQSALLGFEFVDFTPGLQAAAPNHTTPETLLYYPTNRHLTKQGHAVVAGILRYTIEENTRAANPRS